MRVNALLSLLPSLHTASLRDDGWFWWMPLAGRLPYIKDSAYPDIPFPPRRVKAD